MAETNSRTEAIFFIDELLLTYSSNTGKISLTADTGNADSVFAVGPGMISCSRQDKPRHTVAIPADIKLQWQKISIGRGFERCVSFEVARSQPQRTDIAGAGGATVY